jgi:hypothetical protein
MMDHNLTKLFYRNLCYINGDVKSGIFTISKKYITAHHLPIEKVIAWC